MSPFQKLGGPDDDSSAGRAIIVSAASELRPSAKGRALFRQYGRKQGLEIIVEAARVLQYRSDLVFVLCGNGAAAERIRVLSDQLPNIRWLPVQPVELLNSLLNVADIHLLPQRADAADLVMPSKLTGMLASGRPVVATAAAGTQIHNVVSKCGLNCEPGNTGDFAAAILKLTDDVDLRIRWGKSAREIAESELWCRPG